MRRDEASLTGPAHPSRRGIRRGIRLGIALRIASFSCVQAQACIRSQHELVFVFKKSSKPHRNNVQMGKHGRHRTNVWTYPGISNFGRRGEEGDLLAMHPTVKPVALIADALLDASARGDIVLDGFMGSGSTMIAAEKVGRRARGIELDPAYVDTAIRRWERWSGEEARLEGTGQTFADIGVERAVELANV